MMDTLPTSTMPYEIIRDNKTAKQLVKYLLTLKAVAWDTETYSPNIEIGLDWVRGKSLWHQYSDGKKAWLIDIRKGRVDVQIFKPLLESDKVKKIIHSSSFDCSWTCREHGIYTKNIHDTRLNEQIILGIALGRGLTKAQAAYFEPLYSASLKHCLARRGWPDKFVFEPFLDLPHEPGEEQQIYMVRDVEFLHALMGDQLENIAHMGLANVSHLENTVAEITYQMMCNGFGLDCEAWIAGTKQEERVYNKVMKELKAIADINWNSWQQYCKFFGVHRTEDLDGVVTLPGVQGKALNLWRSARLHHKNVTTYGREWIAQHYYNGLVRCQYTQMVSTARYSCDSPNLQNVPAETFHRACMVPGHGKNNVFVIADYSSQELAVMAYGSGEERWLQCLRDGGDLHSMVAADVLGDEWHILDADQKARQRKVIKIINFSIAYGAGKETIAMRAGVDVQTIARRLSVMERQYRDLFRWLKRNGDDAKRTFETRSFPPFNRYRSLTMEVEGWRRINIGKNSPIQSSSADMMKLSMVYMQQEIDSGLPAIFIHTLHDELVLECKKSHSKKVASKLAECMSAACAAILGEALSNPDVKIKSNWAKKD